MNPTPQSWISLVRACLDAQRALIVSPASEPSALFAEDLRRFADAIAGGPVPGLAAELRVTAEEFGDWQREVVDGLRRDLLEAIVEMTRGLRALLDEGDESLDEWTTLNRRLAELSQVDDLARLRAGLRDEVERATQAITHRAEKNAGLRRRFEATVAEFETRLQTAERYGTTDYLTDVANRAAFDFYLQAILAKVRETNKEYALVLLDLDDFKAINDRLGHAGGDAALATLVRVAKDEFGKRGFVARYGGDEFAIVFQGTLRELEPRMGSLFAALLRETVVAGDQVLSGIHASAGATRVAGDDTVATAVERADAALYEAKRAGKGRLVIDDERQFAA